MLVPSSYDARVDSVRPRGFLARGSEFRIRTDLQPVVASYLILFQITMAYSYGIEWELMVVCPLFDN